MKKLHLTKIKQFAPASIARERRSPDLDVGVLDARSYVNHQDKWRKYKQ